MFFSKTEANKLNRLRATIQLFGALLFTLFESVRFNFSQIKLPAFGVARQESTGNSIRFFIMQNIELAFSSNWALLVEQSITSNRGFEKKDKSPPI